MIRRGSHLPRGVTIAAATLSALLLLVAACDASSDPAESASTQDPDEIRLGVGDEVMVRGTALRIHLVGVMEDSRCPVDAVCVWQGNAAVQVGLAVGPGVAQPFVLNTAVDPRWVDFRGARVTLIGVAPEPVEGRGVPAEEYIVSLRAEPTPIP